MDFFAGQSVKDFTQESLMKVIGAVREANTLPKLGENYELYSSFPVFAQFMKIEASRAIKLVNRLNRHAGCKSQISIDGVDDEEKMDRLIDANDSLLEQIGNFLDEASGIRKKPEPVLPSTEVSKPVIKTAWNKQLHETLTPTCSADSSDRRTKVNKEGNSTQQQGQKTRFRGSRNMSKPQLKFKELIDNSNSPFVIKLKTKHNALEKWKGNMQMVVDGEVVETAEEATDRAEVLHPYHYELTMFQPNEKLLERCKPNEVSSLDETPLHFVDTTEKLKDLCEKLKGEKEFAVDLEHHDYRTFLGLTCLMQISTRTEDYIVDTLELWQDMDVLNDPFSDPEILKVFHGAEKDIEWLQRDFGIYVVNMFDTGQAMRLLNLPRFSLAFLLEHYLKKSLDKQYRLADWRIRPLADELIKYAREDSHYLLYCYDCLKNDLLDQGKEEKNLLRAAFLRSRDLCLNHYQKPIFNPEGYLELETRSRKTLNPRQKWALKELFAWRDSTARQCDESLKFVLPDHMLLQIADVLPREMQGILACCNPIPPLIKQELHELHTVVLQARDRPLTLKTEAADVAEATIVKQRALNPLIHKLHDYSHTQEEEEMIPLSQRLDGLIEVTKEAGSSVTHSSPELSVKESPSLRIFSDDTEDKVPDSKKKKSAGRKKGKKKQPIEAKEDEVDWISPYEQYLLAKKFSEENRYELRSKRKSESTEAEGSPEKKRMYSHKDKAERISPNIKNTGNDLEFPEPPTKKAKKGTMERIEEALAREMKKAAKKVEEAKKKAANVLPFDYSKTKKDSIFNAEKTEIKAFFDPDKALTGSEKKNSRKKQKGKGRKGKKGIASKTLSYALGGNNKKK